MRGLGIYIYIYGGQVGGQCVRKPIYIYIDIYGGQVGGQPLGYLAGAKLLLDRRPVVTSGASWAFLCSASHW